MILLFPTKLSKASLTLNHSNIYPEIITENSQSTESYCKQSKIHWKRAKASLQRALNRYSVWQNASYKTTNPEFSSTVKTQLELLKSNIDKLDQGVIQIAVFGLVSRGKSAVLNALLGEKILETGPLNGVTKWPRSIRWTPNIFVNFHQQEVAKVDLIDTPGLDEVADQVRGEMAKEVTRQADLILFVVSGDITRTEYDALYELKKSKKPLILVFNKIDLYSEVERQEIYKNLQNIAVFQSGELDNIYPTFEVVMVAAEPTPLPVIIEMPDGKVTHEWETPSPKIDELRQKIITILEREGRSLLALNALLQARKAEVSIAQKTVKIKQNEADDLIWDFAKYKALAIAFNPITIIDVVGTTVIDLALIRSLSRLYNLPMTSYEAGKLWKIIIFSAGGILLGDLGTSLLLGLGKVNIISYTGVAITQASVAAYGTYAIGSAAKVYLENGCTWGDLGQDIVIQDILSQMEPDTIIYRLQQELFNK
ncbi:small GTP-binding protein [Trichodesmium erythraeum IMS101]|uniref:Small GTP-binding protein n=1 Tax=Trichodesmium erythraeum (strain IMS101) TaxID=203124 RepID=Q10XZ3_TRIEI|nr:GTP-binding protein [Trichodesmium erythraeum GBRTRLIN201]